MTCQPLDDCASVEVYGVYTMVRSPTSGLCVGEGLGGASILDAIFGTYTPVRSGTNVLICGKAFTRKQGMMKHMKACNNG